jgi:hypothetical protein
MSGSGANETTFSSLMAGFFRGLHFSIFTLWGLVFGAGLSVPIVLNYWRYAFGMELTWTSAIGLGCYLLLVGLLGTWLSLGLLGAWAGRTGGRPLRLVVQVCGILLTACLTLFCAMPLTLLAMAWVGRHPRSQETWKSAVVFLVMVALVYGVEIRPALQSGVVAWERAKRGKAIGALIEAKLDACDEELNHQTWSVSRDSIEFPVFCDFQLKWVAKQPEAEAPFPLFDLAISCPDGNVIRIITRGGTKEDDFLAALTAVIEEHGWKMDVTREAAETQR